MQIEVTVTHTIAPEVLDALCNILKGALKTPDVETETTDSAPAPTKAKKAPEPKVRYEAKEAKEAKEKPAERITLEDVSDKALQLANSGKRDEVKAALKQFGAAKVSLLDEEQFEGFLTVLNEM